MVAAVAVVGYVGGQAVKAHGARKAGKDQLKGIGAAKDDLNAGYDKALEYQQPYLDAGKQTIGQLASGLQDGGDFNRSFTAADFEVDPGYQFRMDQGQKAVERSAAARGGALSGAAIKASNEYGQNLASQEYRSAYDRYQNDLSQRFNRLSSVAQMGQRAADHSSQIDAERGTSLGNLSLNKGNVKAGVALANSAAIANSLQAVGNYMSGGIGGAMSGGGSAEQGSTIGGYTGGDYAEWVKRQNSGGSTSYGRY